MVPALLLAGLARPAFAQYAGIGDTIRVALAGTPMRTIDGKLSGVSQDSVFIARSHQPELRLARAEVEGLFVSRDGGDYGVGGGWSGMSFGFFLGGAGGAAVAGPRILGRFLGAVGGAVIGASVGAIAGEAIGSHQRYKTWVAIPWPATPLPESTR